MYSKRRRELLRGIRHYVIVTLIALFVLFPYYWMITMSIKPVEEVMLSPPTLVPHGLNFTNYIKIWKSMPLFNYLKNSFIVAGITTGICIVFSCLCGYSLSRFTRGIPQRITVIIILLAQLIPGSLPLISLYFNIFNAGLTNTYTGLIIAYTAWGLPFSTLMMRSYFSTAVPTALEESAIIDGCSRFGVFRRIALPLSFPGVVAIAIYTFILAWNEFQWASIILSDGSKKPASIGVYSYVGQWGANTNIALTVTAGVLLTLPAVIFFGFLQKYLISGLTSGAVKE